ncbi:TPA: hypothetical protein ROY01_004575 [Bacillus toyonensis]|nr:hypothetical protein [Bacillus toyonensis]
MLYAKRTSIKRVFPITLPAFHTTYKVPSGPIAACGNSFVRISLVLSTRIVGRLSPAQFDISFAAAKKGVETGTLIGNVLPPSVDLSIRIVLLELFKLFRGSNICS